MRERLYRSRQDQVIGGVAGGVGDALDVDPSIVRVVWVLLALMTGGIAAVVYLVMLIVVPEAPEGAQSTPARSSGAAIDPASPGSARASDPLDPADTTVPHPLGAAAAPASARRTGHARRNGGGALVFGVILILVGAYFLVRQYIPAIDLDRFWPVIVIVVGAALVIGALRSGSRTGG